MVRLLALLGMALPLAAAQLRVPMVMYPGQKATHTSKQALTAIRFEDPWQAAVLRATFDQYQDEIALKAVKTGEAVLVCETVDGRASEVLDVSVVPRDQYELHRSVASRFAGVDGVAPADVTVAGSFIVVLGRVYDPGALQECREMERGGKVVCALRLAPSVLVVTSAASAGPRASLELSQTERGWRVSVRVAEIPVVVAESPRRGALLSWTVPLVRSLNTILSRNAASPGAYPPVITARRAGRGLEIIAVGDTGSQARHTVLTSIPSETMAAVAATGRTSSDLVARWWAALLQDAVRMSLFGERPARTSTASRPSPLLRIYEHALELRGSGLVRDSAAVDISRAVFALALVHGEGPALELPLAVPSDLGD